MKRFVACLAVFLILLGLRLADNGILDCGYSGEYSVWQSSQQVTTYSSKNTPKLASLNSLATRLDFAGSSFDAARAIKNLGGEVKWTEEFEGGLSVMYAYSPNIFKSRVVNGNKINIMVAFNNGVVSVGSPILQGSY